MASEQGSSCSMEFRRFDIVSDVSDHHYIKSNESGKEMQSFANANGTVQCQIMKEWKILETDLPDSIYVRAYETRIDLLRAVIIGAPGTPYHDGLFFFDIVFPSDYPKHPPKVYYHAHGLRLNPNLYANGKVCLSLINTWSGAKPEKWTPTKSTILQLLVSIQGLVLNDKPYFNEPGTQVSQNKMTQNVIKKYMAYNETAFLLSCKTMLNHMNNQPKHFESLVAEHFQMRAEHILAALGAYRNGFCLVGHYSLGSSSPSKPLKVSPSFKDSLDKFSAALHLAFKKIGKTSPIVHGSEMAKNGSRAKTVVETEANTGSSSSAKPQAFVGKPKSSKQKGVWKRFISALEWISK
ncbi:hypothetical protein Leryth_012944 [Lithospermum erythrorhizon]|nr:hypothetical protein Leryth_012944 [Lithospermum erythrorhizon]